MALSIKTAEADRLARELSRATGETMTQAVTVALRERLDRVRPNPTPEEIEARVKDILDAAAALRANLKDTTPMTKADFDALWEDGPGENEDTPAKRSAGQ